MKYRRLDANGDYTFGQSSYNFLDELSSVAQAIQTNLLLLYGEWWEDIENGTPLFNFILNQRMSDEGRNAVDILVKERILDTVGVVSLSEYKSEFDYQKSTILIVLSVESEYGTIENLSINLGV